MLRIIGGDLKRRKLQTPPDAKTTRPMPDHVREAVFNLLRGHCEGQAVLDAFTGSGAIGLEAASRGAGRVVLIEKDRKVARVVQRNIDELGVGDRVELVVGDALGPAALVRCPNPVHLIFFDPPYPLVSTEASWRRVRTQFSRLIGRLDDGGFAVLRTPWPFVTRGGDADGDAASEKPPRRGASGRRPGRRGTTHDDRSDDQNPSGSQPNQFVDDDGETMVEIIDDSGLLPKPAEASGGRSFSPVDLDLSIEGADGPETHRYGSMAVHLYMRSRYTQGADASGD